MDPRGSRPAAARYFAGLAEDTFQSRLGVADPALIDYIAELLTRFIHADAIYQVRNLSGRRLSEVAEMLCEAEARIGSSRREVHRHIGDFTLFWSGLYPEALDMARRHNRVDALLDYREQGKRAYHIASTIQSEEFDEENRILERLSHDFELCEYGLREVRREWERREPLPNNPSKWLLE